MIPGGWMAWVLPTALFFWVIGSLLITFAILAIRFPETPRLGVLRIETTRGDRLFISLLGLRLHLPDLALRLRPAALGRADLLPDLCRSGVPLGMNGTFDPAGGELPAKQNSGRRLHYETWKNLNRNGDGVGRVRHAGLGRHGRCQSVP